MTVRDLSISELHDHVGGAVWLDAIDRGWDSVALRGYTFDPVTTSIWLRRHTLIMYLEGATTMRRRVAGHDVIERVGPGDISLKNCDTVGEWEWRDGTLDVVHLYVTPELLERVGCEMYGPGFGSIQLRDSVRTRDDEISQIAASLMREANHDRSGGRVVADALSRQLAVALIRSHANVIPSADRVPMFDARQSAVVSAYIAANLAGDLSVGALARSLHLSIDHFSRLFSATFKCAPHKHVMAMRVERARELLTQSTASAAEIALETGFADQSHLTRCFKRRYGQPPSAWRRDPSGDPGAGALSSTSRRRSHA